MKPIFTFNHSRYYETNEQKLLSNLSKLIIHTLAIYTFVLLVKNPFIAKQVHKPKTFVKPKVNVETKDYNDLHNDYEQMRINKTYELAKKYEGIKGDCYYISIKFIKELKGLTDYELVEIPNNEVETGDLIYYRNNGLGQTHYGIVIDYDNNISLQPNWNGRAIIGQILYDTFSKPIYYRLVERTK